MMDDGASLSHELEIIVFVLSEIARALSLRHFGERAQAFSEQFIVGNCTKEGNAKKHVVVVHGSKGKNERRKESFLFFKQSNL